MAGRDEIKGLEALNQGKFPVQVTAMYHTPQTHKDSFGHSDEGHLFEKNTVRTSPCVSTHLLHSPPPPSHPSRAGARRDKTPSLCCDTFNGEPQGLNLHLVSLSSAS
ncbi:hypothetical protein RRG08_067261 [Elysia crispata]|uniref:Uncharacterized protein n=1 Tax=Elysia crispata TaxID=231223 RepID=A0AAE0Y8I8_9GAST|nr:hypothetical protein RRG08_067261 [Elysia crispata]